MYCFIKGLLFVFLDLLIKVIIFGGNKDCWLIVLRIFLSKLGWVKVMRMSGGNFFDNKILLREVGNFILLFIFFKIFLF